MINSCATGLSERFFSVTAPAKPPKPIRRAVGAVVLPVERLEAWYALAIATPGLDAIELSYRAGGPPALQKGNEMNNTTTVIPKGNLSDRINARFDPHR